MKTLKSKVKLSPKLQLGVGRGTKKISILPYASIIFLTLSLVLIVRAGYMVINKSSDIPKNQPQVLGAETNTPSSEELFQEYTIKTGDTVFSIGQNFNVDWSVIATLNDLKPPFALKPGQTLKIPRQ